MMQKRKDNGIVKRITTKYVRTLILSVGIFALSLGLLFILKGSDYFIGGLIIGAFYFFSLLSSKNIDVIEIKDSNLIMFKYYSFGIIKKEMTYDMASLYIDVKRVVAFKGGVNYYMKFYTSGNKKIFEISIRDFNDKEDFSFLENLFSRGSSIGSVSH